MRKDFEKLFSTLEGPVPPPRLLGNVLARIRAEERRMAIARRIWLFAAAAASTGVLYEALRALAEGVRQSGLAQLARLLVSDADIVFSSAGDFALLVLESVPAWSLAALLVSGAVFAVTVERIGRDLGRIVKT